MELIRLAAFIVNSEVAACHSEVLPAILMHLNSLKTLLLAKSFP